MSISTSLKPVNLKKSGQSHYQPSASTSFPSTSQGTLHTAKRVGANGLTERQNSIQTQGIVGNGQQVQQHQQTATSIIHQSHAASKNNQNASVSLQQVHPHHQHSNSSQTLALPVGVSSISITDIDGKDTKRDMASPSGNSNLTALGGGLSPALQSSGTKQFAPAKTPNVLLNGGNLHQTDYYSVQSNSSSRNVSQHQAQTGTFNKNSQPNNQQNLRNSATAASSRNATNTYTMIKSSNVVSQPNLHQPLAQQQQQQQSGRTQKHHHLYYNHIHVSGVSPPCKPTRTNTLPNQEMTIVPTRVRDTAIKIAQSTAQHRQSFDHNALGIQTVKMSNSSSVERSKQRGMSATFRTDQLTVMNRLSNALPSNGVTRRTNVLQGASLNVVNQSQKPLVSPSKSLQVQQSQSNKQQSKPNQVNGSTAINNNPFSYQPQPSESSELTLPQSKSIVLSGSASLEHNNHASQLPTATQTLQYSPKQPTFGFKSPQNLGCNRKHTNIPLINALSSGVSPLPSQANSRQQLVQKATTSRLSLGAPAATTFHQAVVSADVSMLKKQRTSVQSQSTTRIIQSKVIRNLNNNALYSATSQNPSCLQIDLQSITKKQSAAKQSSSKNNISDIVISENDEHNKIYTGYGGSGSPRSAIKIGKQVKSNTLNTSQSPQSNRVSQQFFGAKSPNTTTNNNHAPTFQKLSGGQQQSSNSNRHSILMASKNPTSTVYQQTKSSLAKSNTFTQNNLGSAQKKGTGGLHNNQHNHYEKYSASKSYRSKRASTKFGNTPAGGGVQMQTSKFEYTTTKKDYVIAEKKIEDIAKPFVIPTNEEALSLKKETDDGKGERVIQQMNEIAAQHQQLFQRALSNSEVIPQVVPVESDPALTLQTLEAVHGLIEPKHDCASEKLRQETSSEDGLESSRSNSSSLAPNIPVLIEAVDLDDFTPNGISPIGKSDSVVQPLRMSVQQQPLLNESTLQPNDYPMTKSRFLDLFQEQLPAKRLEQLEKDLPESNSMIYFPGLILKPILNNLRDESDNDEDEDDESSEEGSPSEVDEKKRNNQNDDEEGYYIVNIGDHLMYRYEILKILGKGSFAQVVACQDHLYPSRQVAIKITRNTELDHKFAQSEGKLLQFLMDKDPEDKHNIVRLLDQFVFREHYCFVFELLPKGDLFEHLKATGFSGFQMPVIKEYARQILKALVFLEEHKVIHCDLKPENILMAGDDSLEDLLLENKEIKVLKLVDFGSGSFRGEQIYTYVQSRFYRAPEVILRLMPPPNSYTEKVDMWSLGCILAELFTGEPLFPGNNEQEQLELIMEICGIPQPSLIDRCRKKEYYFDVDYSPFLIEEEELGILRIPDSRKLEQVIVTSDKLFIDFLKNCLICDPDLRSSASEAIQHPWLSSETLSTNNLNDEVLDLSSSHQPLQTETDHPVISNSVHNLENLANNMSSTQVAFIAASSSLKRRTEEHESGARGTQFEESPERREEDEHHPQIKKTTLIQKSMQQTPKAEDGLFKMEEVKVLLKQASSVTGEEQYYDSNTSTPKNEGGIQQRRQSSQINFRLEKDLLSPSQVSMQGAVGGGSPTGTALQRLLPPSSYLQEESKRLPLQSHLSIPIHNAPLASLNNSQCSQEKRRDRSARKKAAQEANKQLELAKTPQKGTTGGLLVVQQSPDQLKLPLYDSQIKDTKNYNIIGQYEIFRDHGDSNKESKPLDGSTNKKQSDQVRESANSLTSGIASEANIPPVNNHTHRKQAAGDSSGSSKSHKSGLYMPSLYCQSGVSPTKRIPVLQQQKMKNAAAATTIHNNNHIVETTPPSNQNQNQGGIASGPGGAGVVTSENTINKITITFYQKRNHTEGGGSSSGSTLGSAKQANKTLQKPK